jgi:hypothetical protein
VIVAGGPEMARTFILITKTLQKAANNSTFEKGQDLFPMNSFITTNHKEIDRFFASISAVRSFPSLMLFNC